MRRPARLVTVLFALGLILAACSSSDDDSSSDTTTTAAPAETTTTTIATTTVDWSFDGDATETEADQAATTMERRLVTFYDLTDQSSDGVAVTVNDDGTGLVITVPGSSEDEANELVAGLAFRGDLYFRPTLVGWPEPADGSDEQSLGTAQLVGIESGETTTTTAGDTTTTAASGDEAEGQAPAPEPEATTPVPAITAPADDDPDGTSVLPWRLYDMVEQLQDPDSAEIQSVWEVGPQALSGSAVEDTEITTVSGNNAVKVVLAEGADGLDAFNTLAESCYDQADTCATGAYAVALDSQLIVVSTPRPGASSFQPFTQDDVIIWSPDWTEDVAVTIAVAFEAGALPVGLTQG